MTSSNTNDAVLDLTPVTLDGFPRVVKAIEHVTSHQLTTDRFDFAIRLVPAESQPPGTTKATFVYVDRAGNVWDNTCYVAPRYG